MPSFVLPYEPSDVTHFEAEKRQKETKDWLRRQRPMVDSPPIAPYQAELAKLAVARAQKYAS